MKTLQSPVDIVDQGQNRTAVFQRYERAKARRQNWEGLWQDCYAYALPQNDAFSGLQSAGAPRMDKIYDATAMDAADRLAASLMGNLTPPWSGWFGLKPGPEMTNEEAEALAPVLEKTGRIMQDHFDRSNFTVEMHQAFLDLVVGGTASLFFEESNPGSFTAFKFTAAPLSSITLEEGESGALDGTFRTSMLTLAQLQSRFPYAELPAKILREGEKDTQARFAIMEALLPVETAFHYSAWLVDEQSSPPLADMKLGHNPIINFRWMKSPGEIYGRSPVMKALPDIKTANKVVELILKNASIAVTGIWQADDDGVLNPANIELVPGAIIPKALGSNGLQPLEMPGRFDISQLVLEDLRSRIRNALLADKLAPVASPRMTATEVLERSSDMAMLLGATYGRLQSELLTPLILRAFSILKRRGEVPDLLLDGRFITIDFRSPLARAQAQRQVGNTLSWLNSVAAYGAEAMSAVDVPQAARYLGEALGVPSDLIKRALPLKENDDVQVL